MSYLNSSRSSRTPAFTLAELLVVMGIILVLAGGIIVAGSRLWRRAQISRTKGIIAILEHGIAEYKATYFFEPPDNLGPYQKIGHSGTPEKYQCPDHGIRNLFIALKQGDFADELKGEDLAAIRPHSQFQFYYDPTWERVVVDAWRQSLFYDYRKGPNITDWTYSLTTKQHEAIKKEGLAYLIYSLGPDGASEYNAGSDDDICNYRK